MRRVPISGWKIRNYNIFTSPSEFSKNVVDIQCHLTPQSCQSLSCVFEILFFQLTIDSFTLSIDIVETQKRWSIWFLWRLFEALLNFTGTVSTYFLDWMLFAFLALKSWYSPLREIFYPSDSSSDFKFERDLVELSTLLLLFSRCIKCYNNFKIFHKSWSSSIIINF